MMRARTNLIPLLGVVALCLGTASEAATLQGKLINRTTGEVGRADFVRLLDVAQGMDPIQTLEDVRGEFTLEDVPETAAHLLLQVEHDGIVYNQSVTPPEDGSPLEVDVYDTGRDASTVEVSIHHVLFQRSGDHLTVTELYEFQNSSDPPVALPGDLGAVRMHIPHDIHGEIEASVGTSRMPVRLPVVETEEAGVFTVDTALRPGATRVLLRYMLSYPEAHLNWEARALYPEADRRVLVSPPDISVEAEKMIATDSQMEGFAAYAGLPITAGESWSVHLHGGSAEAPDMASGGAGRNGGPSEVTRIVVRPNRMSDSQVIILAGLSLVLLLGMTLGLSTGQKHTEQARAATEADEKIRARISKLADRYISGAIERDQFERERDQILGGKQKSGASPAGAPRAQTAGR